MEKEQAKRMEWGGGEGGETGGKGVGQGEMDRGQGVCTSRLRSVAKKKKTVPATLDIPPLVLSSSASCRLLASCYSWVPATLLCPQARQAPMHLYFPPQRIRPFKCCLLNRAA